MYNSPSFSVYLQLFDHCDPNNLTKVTEKLSGKLSELTKKKFQTITGCFTIKWTSDNMYVKKGFRAFFRTVTEGMNLITLSLVFLDLVILQLFVPLMTKALTTITAG